MDFLALAQQCAPDIHPDTMQRVVRVESSFNPYAIGVVSAHLVRQPQSLEEAIVTAQALEAKGYNYSVGLGQINKRNFQKYGLTLQTAFQACANLGAANEILKDCFLRARKRNEGEQTALRDAFSCYYSGNFVTGHKEGYVSRVTGQRSIRTQSTENNIQTLKQASNSSLLF